MSYLSCWSMPNRRLVYNSVGVSPGAGMRNSKSPVRAAQGFYFALTALRPPQKYVALIESLWSDPAADKRRHEDT